jgi:hypothetical protein
VNCLQRAKPYCPDLVAAEFLLDKMQIKVLFMTQMVVRHIQYLAQPYDQIAWMVKVDKLIGLPMITAPFVDGIFLSH